MRTIPLPYHVHLMSSLSELLMSLMSHELTEVILFENDLRMYVYFLASAAYISQSVMWSTATCNN